MWKKGASSIATRHYWRVTFSKTSGHPQPHPRPSFGLYNFFFFFVREWPKTGAHTFGPNGVYFEVLIVVFYGSGQKEVLYPTFLARKGYSRKKKVLHPAFLARKGYGRLVGRWAAKPRQKFRRGVRNYVAKKGCFSPYVDPRGYSPPPMLAREGVKHDATVENA